MSDELPGPDASGDGRELARSRWRLDLSTPTDGSLASRGALSTTGLASQGVLRFATSWLVGRLAGQAALGTVQAAISTGTLLALLWPTTSGSAASKYLARARGAGDQAELYAVATHLRRRVALAALVVALLALPAWLVLDHGLLGDAVWVAAFAAAYSGYSFARGVFFGAGQVRRATAWDVIGAGLGLVGLAVALALGLRGTALLLPIAGAYLLYTAAGWPRSPSVPVPPALGRELDQMIMLGVAGTIASTGFLQIAMIVAKASGGAAEAGAFAAAMVTATPASMLAASLGLVLFPALAQAWGRGDKDLFRRQTDQAFRVLVLVMVLVLGALVLMTRLVMRVVWGEGFADSSAVFPVLIAAILVTSLAIASVNALTTRTHRAMVITSGASVSGLVVGALVWLAVVPQLGMLGVAVGYLAGSLVNGIVPIVVEWRVGGHAWGRVVLRLGLGGLMVAVAFVGQRVLQLPIASDLLVAALFGVIWLAMSRRDLELVPGPLASRLSRQRARRRHTH